MRDQQSTHGQPSVPATPPLRIPIPIGIRITWDEAAVSEPIVIGRHQIGPVSKPCRVDPDKYFWQTPEVPPAEGTLDWIISELGAGRRAM